MPSKTTNYIVRVYNEAITCYDTASIKIVVWPKPQVSAGPDKFTYSQKPVVLDGKVTGTGLSYSWSPPTGLNNTLITRPQATPLQTIKYELIATSNYGCGSDTDEVEVKVIDSLLIPTAFTPNADGLNDFWEIITFTKYKEAVVEVYNRWGQRMYTSTGANYIPWDGTFEGKPVIAGTYVYYLRLNKKLDAMKGTVTVVR
jgi:gliding motility-associated-like protein